MTQAADPSKQARSLFAKLRHAAPEPGGPVQDADLIRFLKRVGLAGPRMKAEEAIAGIAQATNEEPAAVREVLQAYCGKDAICGDNPDCIKCPVSEECPFCSRKPRLKDLPEQDRPRERLINGGEEQLANAELLGIIIRDGTTDATAVDLGSKLLSRYGDFASLATKSVGELCQIKGIGPAKAAQIKAALTLGKRMHQQLSVPAGTKFTSGRVVYDYCAPHMQDLKKEVFKVLLLDTKNRLIREVRISEGTLTASMVHPREAFNPAIRDSANAVIFVHNHPSGDPTPSRDDIDITRQMKQAADVLGIRMLDHVVIGRGRHFSFADEGHLSETKP